VSLISLNVNAVSYKYNFALFAFFAANLELDF